MRVRIAVTPEIGRDLMRLLAAAPPGEPPAFRLTQVNIERPGATIDATITLTTEDEWLQRKARVDARRGRPERLR